MAVIGGVIMSAPRTPHADRQVRPAAGGRARRCRRGTLNAPRLMAKTAAHCGHGTESYRGSRRWYATASGDMVWMTQRAREDTCRSRSCTSIPPRFGRDD